MIFLMSLINKGQTAHDTRHTTKSEREKGRRGEEAKGGRLTKVAFQDSPLEGGRGVYFPEKTKYKKTKRR
jgi:hypothetical protein